jgi:hypothetical protein
MSSLFIFSCAPPVITNPKPSKVVYSPSNLKASKEDIKKVEKKKELLRKEFGEYLETEFGSLKEQKRNFDRRELKPFLGGSDIF